MKVFKKGDRVEGVAPNDSGGVIGTVSHFDAELDYAFVEWDDDKGNTMTHLSETIQHAFRSGDQVEHVDNAPGHVGTVIGGPWTSGMVQVEWPLGIKDTEQVKFLKHAQPAFPLDATESICRGNIWQEGPHPVYAAKASDAWTGPRNIVHHETRASAMAAAETADAVHHPSHYTAYPVEVIDLTEHMNFNRGNAVKCIARAGLKDKAKEAEDLEKARWYISRELDRLKKETP